MTTSSSIIVIYCLFILINFINCIQDYCSMNNFPTNTTSMQFIKEASVEEFAIVGKFKGLHCCAKGYRSIEWYKDGKPYPWPLMVSQLIIYPESANQTVYTQSVTEADSGNYTCLLKNDSMVHSHTIQLRVFSVTKKIKASLIGNLVNQTIYSIVNSIPDPIEVQNENLTIADGPFAGNASIGNFKITGTHNVEVPVLTVSGLLLWYSLDLKIVLESLVLSTNYQAEMELLYGEGDLNVKLSNLSVEITATITLPIAVSNLEIVINLGGCVVELTGYYYDDDLSKLISNGLTNDTASYINDNQETITNILSPIVQEAINNLLSGSSEYREEIKTLITELAQQNEFVDNQ